MCKGQLISKADWSTIDSPQKITDEFVLFAFLLFMANKSNSSVHFLGEATARQSAFWFYFTFIMWNINDLGILLGGAGLFHMIHIVKHNLVTKHRTFTYAKIWI